MAPQSSGAGSTLYIPPFGLTGARQDGTAFVVQADLMHRPMCADSARRTDTPKTLIERPKPARANRITQGSRCIGPTDRSPLNQEAAVAMSSKY